MWKVYAKIFHIVCKFLLTTRAIGCVDQELFSFEGMDAEGVPRGAGNSSCTDYAWNEMTMRV